MRRASGARAAASEAAWSRSSVCDGPARGRGELLTVTGAQTVDAYPRLRGTPVRWTARARLRRGRPPVRDRRAPPGGVQLLCRHLGLLDEQVSGTVDPPANPRPRRRPVRSPATQLAGGAPAPWRSPEAAARGRPGAQLGACACCGEREHLVGSPVRRAESCAERARPRHSRWRRRLTTS